MPIAILRMRDPDDVGRLRAIDVTPRLPDGSAIACGPVAMGGTDTDGNAHVLCCECHQLQAATEFGYAA
ncbi:hypothetical protein [Streptomyces umbrinus]|uniref:hypothetical protein n=1 Tax=Streptomyces umbrinus TaxID=67370 RepID=UPI003C2FCD4A